MSTIKTYRDLIAWQKAMKLAEQVYRWSAHFPPDEKYGLTSQMRRAAVSIPSNIAEGYGRQSTVDYVRFLRIARGSLAELSTQIELVVNIGIAEPDDNLHDLVSEEDRVLQGLIRSLDNRS